MQTGYEAGGTMQESTVLPILGSIKIFCILITDFLLSLPGIFLVSKGSVTRKVKIQSQPGSTICLLHELSGYVHFLKKDC